MTNPDALLEWIARNERNVIGLIREMVVRESPSDDPEALASWAEWFGEVAATFGGKIENPGNPNLVFRFGPVEADRQILVLGHYDTVWPLDTLLTMPYREAGGRLWGPGVLDMKGGIAIFLSAMQALDHFETPPKASVLLQLNCDEETGSHTSRELTETNALASQAVLVLEPGTGLAGKLKTARKGVGGYRLTVRGRSAHAGLDFEAGASAILELSRQLLRIADFSDLSRGLTVNPGVVRGGTRSNVIAAEASAEIDVRVASIADAESIHRQFQSLQPIDPRCTLHIEGGLNRPPMERTPAIGELFHRARRLGSQIGVAVEDSFSGGGSDGNFTAAMGIATLDGLGAVGEGAHAAHESMLVERLADRTALLALLLAAQENGE